MSLSPVQSCDVCHCDSLPICTVALQAEVSVFQRSCSRNVQEQYH